MAIKVKRKKRKEARTLGDEAETTIFSSRDTMDTAEREAVKSGEERGKRMVMAEDPERFGMARQRALGKQKYDENYEKIIW